MQLIPNLEINFADMPLRERIALIDDLGFPGFDLFKVTEERAADIEAACKGRDLAVGMTVAASVKPGLLDPAVHEEAEALVRKAAPMAQRLRARNVVILAGNTLPGVARSAQIKALIEGLKRLIPVAEEHEITVVTEMLNSRYDHPGYFLDDTELMTGVIRAVDHPRIRALYDVYHAGVMRGNIIEDIRASIDTISHVHIAGIPGRNEPAAGEQNYPVICRAMREAGYDGLIGLEYKPLKRPEESLRETRDWIEGGAD